MPNAAQASTALSWYCWGSLSTIECGVDDAVEPRRWTGLEDADVVQCGGTHCLAVRSGQVHAWGANSHGQCGAERDNRIHPPTTVQFAVPVETVACGWWHSLVLTRDGRVASWGHPEQIGRDGDPFQCQLIPDVCQVRQISCGFRHSIAVANNGSVYAWGQNKFGQLGIAPSKTMVARPVRSASIDARFASCGLRHSVVLTGIGTVISAGENRYGQLDDCRCSFWLVARHRADKGGVRACMGSIRLWPTGYATGRARPSDRSSSGARSKYLLWIRAFVVPWRDKALGLRLE
ncbi:unnamed protein product (mitochondrion) [Plasmodiophora brassicae]|uniref:RCC1-like domain-containing protein n=1 Tax=Plasmodiophora brassicae TaxID=37360 RepID=A0A3P3XYP1_PLABS|nr:unnamed protein product [Plasmodiophora brassicae]